jgi:hypothetical protein
VGGILVADNLIEGLGDIPSPAGLVHGRPYVVPGEPTLAGRTKRQDVARRTVGPAAVNRPTTSQRRARIDRGCDD